MGEHTTAHGPANLEARPAPVRGSGLQMALRIENLSKSFAGNLAVKDVDLAIGRGEVHVVVGQNGSGKSTLIKVLSGYHQPDPGGTVFVGEHKLPLGSPEHSYRLGCRFVHQDLGLIETVSVLDNLSYGPGFPTRFGTIRRRAALGEAKRVLRVVGLHLDPRQKMADLSPAQRTEVAVARALRADAAHPPVLLVLDEPTATMPIDEVDRLLATVRRVAASGIAVLYVTHHMDEVFRVADRVTVLRDGIVVGTSSIAEVDQRTLISRLVGAEVEDVRRNSSTAQRGAGPALVVDELSSGPLRDLSFHVAAGEIVGFAGLTGSGRETVLGSVFGANPRDAGEVRVNGQPVAPDRPDLAMNAGLAYLPGDRKVHGGIMSLSARENLTLTDLRPFWSGLRLRRRAEAREAMEWFARLQIRPPRAAAPLVTFSGGNQQKILFGKCLRLKPAIFLSDEPTQGVDVGAKAELHRHLLSLAKEGTGVVISSTDDDELAALCDRVLVLRHGQIAHELSGQALDAKTISRSTLTDE